MQPLLEHYISSDKHTTSGPTSSISTSSGSGIAPSSSVGASTSCSSASINHCLFFNSAYTTNN